MKIKRGLYVVFEFKMFAEPDNELFGNESRRPIGFIVGEGHMLPAVERRLIGMEPGSQATIYLEPLEAFGEHDPAKLRIVARDDFPEGMEPQVGMFFIGRSPEGNIPFFVRAVEDEMVTVDTNHPLAGKRIQLEIKIHEVRALTEQEKKDLKKDQAADVDGLMSVFGVKGQVPRA
jgi:FKBP-type peptidyl-prolyl cis-trans isomerase 2